MLAWAGKTYWTAWTAARLLSGRRFPYLPSERLRRIQDRRVRTIVAHAYHTVPFYRRAMDERGLRPANFHGAADLARLPIVTGRALADDPEQFRSQAVAGAPLLELWTSGSSGHAKCAAWDRRAVFELQASGLRQRDVIAAFTGSIRGYRQLVVDRPGGTRDRVVAFVREHSWQPSAPGFALHRVSLGDSFERAIEAINRVDPHVIYGFSGYLGALFRRAAAEERHVARPRVIWGGGEMLPAPDRALIEGKFGIPVVESYQACEAMQIAFQCERRGGLHIHVDQVAIRVVDASGEPVPSGRTGRLLISNLINRATVLLNYDIGDLGALTDATCDCGRTLPMLAQLDGRDDDLVARPGGRVVHTAVILASLYAVPGVLRVQLEQTALDRVRLRVVCVPSTEWEQARPALERALASVLGDGPPGVEIERVDEIAAAPSGKFKVIVSRLSGSAWRSPPTDP
ncbi:MAG TPA: hypothetical protein VEL75_14160 [Candidatus Methylomirabilis sp.]|nr:hypothetical protein [Candidatus Methylomirabilis sp.]